MSIGCPILMAIDGISIDAVDRAVYYPATDAGAPVSDLGKGTLGKGTPKRARTGANGSRSGLGGRVWGDSGGFPPPS